MPDSRAASDDRCSVAVIGLGRGTHAEPGPSARFVHRYASAITQHTGVRAEVLDLAATGIRACGSELSRRGDLAALTLLHGNLSAQVAIDTAGLNLPVVSDLDALAITATAAVLTTLSRSRRPTARGRVVVAGADVLPCLTPLLVAADAGDVTLWRLADRHTFPLRTVTAGADVVINLLDDDRELIALTRQDRVPVINPDPLRDSLLVLPALVAALVSDPALRLDSSNDLEMFCNVGYASALALVMATPPERTYPLAPTRELTARVMAAAAATNQQHRRSRP